MLDKAETERVYLTIREKLKIGLRDCQKRPGWLALKPLFLRTSESGTQDYRIVYVSSFPVRLRVELKGETLLIHYNSPMDGICLLLANGRE